MCEVLEVSRSGYHKWTRNRDGKRSARRKAVAANIETIFEASRRTYGVRRVYAQLRREGVVVNRKVVQKIMHERQLCPRRKRKYRSTTDSKHTLPIAEHRLKRNFAVDRANAVWVSDITYIDTQEGWMYLCVWIDLYSRMVVGWSMSERMTADLVTSAFEMAVQRRNGQAPALVHSDRGCQYASKEFQKKAKKCLKSMSRKGNCWDNAVAESFFSTLKSELIYRETYKSRGEAEMSVFSFIEIFYNKTRLHSTLGYVSPKEFEEKGRTAA